MIEAVPLPPVDKSYIRLVWARHGAPVKAVSHSRRVVGALMHWDGSRTVLCVGHQMDCAWCRERRACLWYGWLAGWSLQHGAACLIQLPKATVQSSLLLSDPAIDLRGATVSLQRVGQGHRGRVQANVKIAERAPDPDKSEPDTLLRLAHVYGLFLAQGEAPAEVRE